jgi:DhnA family fructose-bisphosphate aldolase class Ia
VQTATFLSPALINRITDLRVGDPGRAWRAAQQRQRRTSLTADGRLNILAADHPARRVTAVGDKPLAMADRADYLTRITRVLASDLVDGVMSTMDILEDLLVLDGILRESGARSMIDGKLLIASLNRGGLAGSDWEMDDPITGATPATCAAWRLDGAKMLLRVCDRDAGSLATLSAASRAITEMNALGLPMFLEPLPAEKTESGFKVVKTADALARLAGVASALGDSSRYLWLKLPYCDGYAKVTRATTLPILLLGGESAGGIAPFLDQLEAGMAVSPNVRGALVGRNVLYPGDGDPLAAAHAVGLIVHGAA